MKSTPLISIVVPIYNSEEFLDRCLKSLVSQSFKAIEIILVNDGSSDSSGNICSTWSKKDSRIKVIHKENEGVTIARKVGLENCTGEWVSFVDSDDELFERSIELLFNHVDEDTDMVCGSLKYTGPFKFKREYTYAKLNGVQYSKKLLRKYVTWGPFGRLTRISLFDLNSFNISSKITHGEDFIMNLRLGYNAKQITLIPDHVYHYMWRPSSAISKNPMLSRSYRKRYKNEINSSIPTKYRRELAFEITNFWISRYWEISKGLIKKVLSAE
ncbi:glycosyltransferase family 2 protein [Sphingobacterium arenae]|uniref:Glycosyltransferase n=1 Tax=Sphingobacterium arenae TaxID=1280598 RepID=A0ABR7Y8Y6_9SPHI|nr:glycosyltransferase [Sphingobacterium arenae]MBD1427778.1 glycosyltransferase [Sphingobacterium arenae]